MKEIILVEDVYLVKGKARRTVVFPACFNLQNDGFLYYQQFSEPYHDLTN